MQEFDLINTYFKHATPLSAHIELGIGDDAAIQHIPAGHSIVTSMDTLIEGVHFPKNTSPFNLGHQSLAVSLSDIAAMGATPLSSLLSLTLPAADEQWLAEFSRGYVSLSNQYQLPLIGGDTTQGPSGLLSISTVVNGLAPNQQALYRRGAQAGDAIYVSGTLGDAGLALHQSQPLPLAQPRISLGVLLRDYASACIDISDGLAADLTHILTASQIGACIDAEKIPLSNTMKQTCDKKDAWHYALSSGDDYELCFCVSPKKQPLFDATIAQLNLAYAVTCIGHIQSGNTLEILDDHQQPIIITQTGYQHFRAGSN